jgi:cell division protein FtsB
LSQATSTTRSEPHRPILGAAVVLFVALLGIASLKSYRDLELAQARQGELEKRILDTRTGIEQLKRRIGRLKSDPAILERLAREDLGLVYPDDVIIELPQPAITASLPPAPAPTPPATAH